MWNIPQVTCIIHEPIGECLYHEGASGYFNHAIENTT